jgi:hypothetical protein
MPAHRSLSSDPRLFHWLQARLAAAMELHERGRITRAELERVETDATLGQYSGPLQFRDGTASLEAAKVRQLLGGRNL